jgi:hypothetical protein
MEIAVLLIAYNRPDLVERRLKELAASDLIPNNVFLSVDGLKESMRTSDKNSYSSMLAALNLPFIVNENHRQVNLGCSKHIITAVTEVLKDFESVIVIEDDVSISPCFLNSMYEALSIAKNMNDIATIGGFSNFHKQMHFPLFFRNNYWRKTKYFSAWGWATTRDFWRLFVEVKNIEDLEIFLSTSTYWKELSERKKNIWLKRFRRSIWDFNVQLILFKYSKMNLLPALRIIDNEGFSDKRSTHTKHNRPRNLLGIGRSNTSPTKIKDLNSMLILRFFWNFIDSNLWAADGLFSVRARQTGLRTWLRNLFAK